MVNLGKWPEKHGPLELLSNSRCSLQHPDMKANWQLYRLISQHLRKFNQPGILHDCDVSLRRGPDYVCIHHCFFRAIVISS